jgi:hypothetical protein
LGYGVASYIAGIPNSVVVKFNLYNNGEDNSTGLYTDGEVPNVPATAIGGGVSLHSGDVLQAHMVYDSDHDASSLSARATLVLVFTNFYLVLASAN